MSLLAQTIGLALAAGGAILLLVALLGSQQTVDLIAGKADQYWPGNNPRSWKERFAVAGAALGLILAGAVALVVTG